MDNKPTIVSFLCNWCSYTGADLAGTSRMKYASNVHIIRVMCSGRVEPAFVLKAFRNGADYIVVGRPIRDAENRKAMAEKIQAQILAQFSSN